MIFLPRTIDKARASLPGGESGAYRLGGFSEDMLEEFGIAVEAFVEAVAHASDDAEVGAFVLARANPDAVAAWNAYVSSREPFGGTDPERVRSIFPFTRERPDLKLALDLLEEDDRRSFPA